MVSISVIAVLALVGFGATQTVDNCPASLPRDEYLKFYGGFCFQFVIYRQKTFSNADMDCRSHGGSLALVKSQDLTDYLVDQLLYEYGFGTKVWIGLSDRETEGTFLWDDGTPLDYTNWAPGKGQLGNATYSTEDCVTLQPSQQGLWDDDICEDGIFSFVEHHYSYICEYKIRAVTTTPTSPSCPTFTCTIDCGDEGYLKDKDTGCNICQCGSA